MSCAGTACARRSRRFRRAPGEELDPYAGGAADASPRVPPGRCLCRPALPEHLRPPFVLVDERGSGLRAARPARDDLALLREAVEHAGPERPQPFLLRRDLTCQLGACDVASGRVGPANVELALPADGTLFDVGHAVRLLRSKCRRSRNLFQGTDRLGHGERGSPKEVVSRRDSTRHGSQGRRQGRR